MEEILKLIEGYGLSLVLLLGALYALYQFFFFSIREVKSTFEKRHDVANKNMQELKEQVRDLKGKINTILEFIKK